MNPSIVMWRKLEENEHPDHSFDRKSSNGKRQTERSVNSVCDIVKRYVCEKFNCDKPRRMLHFDR